MSESHDPLLMPGSRVPLREATPYGQVPKYLIRDNESKFGPCFARVARTSGIKILKTPYHAPRANAVCERFLRSVRQECLDHLLILHEKQLQRVLNAYVTYFNHARPHQGIGQHIPEPSGPALSSHLAGNKVMARPVMGGLHHDYRWAVFRGTTNASVRLVDEVYPARSVMPEEVFCSSHMQPVHAFLESRLPKDACFLSCTKTISLLDRWLSPTSPPERSGRKSSRGHVLERMC